MSLFYTTEVSDNTCVLGEDEAKHALRVLRLSVGDTLQLTDGKGNRYEGVLASSDIKDCAVENVRKIPGESMRPYKLHIAIAPTKKISRFEWFLEKAGEVGVDEITPIACEHSERRKLQPERLNRILLGAMKQSNQIILPVLNPIISFDDFIASTTSISKNKFIASFGIGNMELSEACTTNQDALVLIGPEGDFTETEIEKAITQGFKCINLGQTRLRTETAGVVVAHTLSLINNQTTSDEPNAKA